MKMKLFKSLSEEDFRNKILKDFYAETQDGFNHLADEINARICSQFRIHINYNHQIENVTIVIWYFGYTTRFFCRCFLHENMRKTFNQILNVLTAFASGISYDC